MATDNNKKIDFKKIIPHSNIDFNSLVKEYGYIKARQQLQRESVKQVQHSISTSEIAANISKQPQRLKDSLQLAKTFGTNHRDAMAEKILKVNPKLLNDLAAGDHSSESIRDFLSGTVQNGEVKKGIETANLTSSDTIVQDNVLMHSLRREDGELAAANQGMDSFPVGFGDTIFLQLAHVQRVSCARNDLSSYISHKIPQLSTYHLRNIREMNLSLNKIRRLPNDFGLIDSLEILNLSHNMISELPKSVGNLTRLRVLNLAHNNVKKIQDELMLMCALESLNLANNILPSFPYALCRLPKLTVLDMSFNACLHLAVFPPLLKPTDMWMDYLDKSVGKMVFMNVFTRERYEKIEYYDGEGVKRAKDLHVFQSEENASAYARRKMWLSICQTYEWEPLNDPNTGSIYYMNNVSGTTSWDIPAVLDSIGILVTMTEFTMTHNSFKSLPQSLGKLVNLKKLVLRSNKIIELFTDIKYLTQLSYLDLSSNDLQSLPIEICECIGLTELIVNDNSLFRLPDALGTLPNLKRLDISINRLTAIPFSLGHCASLSFLNASENPLTDPPIDELSKGLESIKWYCRNRLKILTAGMPPEMHYHSIGIEEQVTILKPEFDRIIEQMVSAVGKDGFLNLQLLGLRKIPGRVLRMTNLKKLKLDFNRDIKLTHFNKNVVPPELASLTLFSLKSCKLLALPESMATFTKLTTLSLEDNRLEQLPEDLVDITTLTSLDISLNKLYSLPEDIDCLKSLKTLMLESNCLEYIPHSISKLTELKLLNVSKNRIVDFPDGVCELSGLKVLSLEKNRLLTIPNRISQLNVVDLKIGHNRIEFLPDNIFSSNLGKSIVRFSFCENNIMELPSSMSRLNPECFIEGDYNPLLSPPAYLLSEGFHVLQFYLDTRVHRKKTFMDLLEEEDFFLDPQTLTPQSTEVLKEGTGFLTPDDLMEFDTATDEFLNGEYFKCPSSAAELVNSLVRLRVFREDEIYLTVIRTVLKVLSKVHQEKDRRFGEASITQSKRPWGLQRELCNVWVVSLTCLLRTAAPNVLLPKGRPSLFSIIEKELPPMAFPFTVDLLKDALRIYQSVYGQIADTEEFEFPACECVDEQRNKPRRHNPCSKAAVTIVKCLYMREEAELREREELEYFSHFEAIDEDLNIWLLTKEGKLTLDREVSTRKKILKEEVKVRSEMLSAQQIKLKKAKEELKRVLTRRSAYEEGEPFEVHNYKSLSEAVKEQTIVEGQILLCNDRAGALKDTIKSLQDRINLEQSKQCKLCTDDLLQKYCVLRYQADLTAYRRQAMENNWLRHWDGEDGKDFHEWTKLHNSRSKEASIMEEQIAEEKRRKELLDENDGPQYNWEGTTEGMAKFQNYLVERFIRKKKERGDGDIYDVDTN